jgi:hypothetical protein
VSASPLRRDDTGNSARIASSASVLENWVVCENAVDQLTLVKTTWDPEVHHECTDEIVPNNGMFSASRVLVSPRARLLQKV